MNEVTKSLLAYWNLHQPGGGKGLPTAGLVFWAPLDTWGARTASGHRLTYRGTASTAVEPTSTTYKGVKCCEFPADCQWSAATRVKEQQEAYAGTLSCWVACKQSLATGYNLARAVTVANSATGSYYYGLWKNSSHARILAGKRASATNYTYNSIPNDVKWKHVCVTLSCAAGWTNTAWTDEVFLDGEKVRSSTDSMPNYGLTTTLVGNANATTTNSLYIAGVRLYNRILNADEIAALAAEYEPTT